VDGVSNFAAHTDRVKLVAPAVDILGEPMAAMLALVGLHLEDASQVVHSTTELGEQLVAVQAYHPHLRPACPVAKNLLLDEHILEGG